MDSDLVERYESEYPEGPIRVHREDVNEAFYCSLLAGRACLEAEGKEPLVLNAGDFVLIPAVKSFTFSSMDPPPPADLVNDPVEGEDGVFQLGGTDADPGVQ
ncbi:Cupin [Roseovarius albus]|uniref:Cupin n=1 Tax=Roseovarius albus TaxID=1247867 RepID=A0A1X6Z2W4_9RHOB|nr:cupin domain-containing protein [Roseovarius albus]SLN38942.1 Cupin [Roseovarius albus]